MEDVQKSLKKKRNPYKTATVILTLVIIVLGLFVSYSFFVKPRFNGYVTDKQIEAQVILVEGIISQINEKGYVQIFDDAGNSIVLVPYQQPQGQQRVQTDSQNISNEQIQQVSPEQVQDSQGQVQGLQD